jgi:hypothetical protein
MALQMPDQNGDAKTAQTTKISATAQVYRDRYNLIARWTLNETSMVDGTFTKTTVEFIRIVKPP